MSRGRRTFLWSALNYLRSFLLFATSIGMAVTCTFLVFFSTVSLSEEEIRTFAPVVFVNVLVLAAICVGIDALRRYVTVKRPARKIQGVLERLMNGDFDARISVPEVMDRYSHFGEIAEHINALAGELAGVETLRTDFIANVSHELKTPMTTIAGYLDGMLDGTIPQAEQRHYMELVSTEVRRLSRLVRNMLEISRLKDQGIPADKLADFDLCEAAGQALLSFEQRINRKHLNVDVDMPELGVTVRAMPDAVTQVLYNLIDNAVKFIDDGGTLSIRVERSGNKAVTTVGNTGPTIAPEELPLICDRFHKTDKSRSTDRDGVGLGLYIVKTIVLAHGEDIYVTSRDGKTEFTFTLPLVL